MDLPIYQYFLLFASSPSQIKEYFSWTNNEIPDFRHVKVHEMYHPITGAEALRDNSTKERMMNSGVMFHPETIQKWTFSSCYKSYELLMYKSIRDDLQAIKNMQSRRISEKRGEQERFLKLYKKWSLIKGCKNCQQVGKWEMVKCSKHMAKKRKGPQSSILFEAFTFEIIAKVASFL